MFYLLAFVIIIIFIIETFKSIKLFDYYKETFKITNKQDNTITNNDEPINLENFESNKNQTNENDDDVKNIMKYGFLPYNIGESSNYQMNPNKSSVQELQEKYDSGLYKYAPSFASNMTYNADYFNPEKEKYNKNRTQLPRDWRCQRPWFDCSKDKNYFNKFKKI